MHTPGPWTVNKGGAFNPQRWGGIEAWNGEGAQDWKGTVAEVCNGPTAEADARLIAAAPDLLEALQRYVGYWSNLQEIDEDDQAMLAQAIKALEKAK